ncbi:MAG: peptidylprolyl isomerase [Planctomycetota bacterium]|jgi:peptidyl-prolyl cis-trans isomerase A (cyclophilin A)
MRHLSPILVLTALCAGSVRAQDESPAETPAAETPNPLAVIKTSHGEIRVELLADQAPLTVANFLGLADGTKEFKDPKTGEMVKRPFYDGLTFHRVMDGFMIQGGCPLGNGMGDPGYKFKDEINGKSLGLHKVKAFSQGRPHQWLLIRDQAQFNQQLVRPLLTQMGIKDNETLQKRMVEVQQRLADLTLLEAYTNMGYAYDETLKSSPMKRGMLAMANSGPNTNGSQFFINTVDNAYLNGKHTVFGRVVAGMETVDRITKVEVTKPAAAPKEPVTILSIRTVPPVKANEETSPPAKAPEPASGAGTPPK